MKKNLQNIVKLKEISTIKDFRFGTFPSISGSGSGSGYTFYRPPTFLCIDTSSCCYGKYRSCVKHPMMHHSSNLPSGKIQINVIVDVRICIKMCSQTKKLFIKVWKKTYEYYWFLSMKQYFVYVNTLYFMAAGIYFHWRVHCRDLVGSKMSSCRLLSWQDFWV